MDEDYIPIDWLTTNRKNLYVHRLTVHPSVWENGYGQILMDLAETFGRDNGYRSVRLDIFNQNLRNQRFYEVRGYRRLANIYFPMQSEHPFYCMNCLYSEQGQD